jgi:hypothetical protein
MSDICEGGKDDISALHPRSGSQHLLLELPE